jgi:hypothetical protein
MEKKKIVFVVTLFLSTLCMAQKADGIIFGAGTNLGRPLGKLHNTHHIGFGGDVVMEYKPPYNPGSGLLDFNFLNYFNYTLSAGYMSFAGKDSVADGQTIKRKNYSIIPVLLGMKMVSFKKYTHLQLGWSFTNYRVPDNAFTWAITWGLLLKKIDLSFRLQGTIKENTDPGFFAGLRVGFNSDIFLER